MKISALVTAGAVCALLTTPACAHSPIRTEDTPATKNAGTTPLKRPWTLEDSIAFKHIATDAAAPVWHMSTNGTLPDFQNSSIVFSSDRKYFFFVRTWGEMKDDTFVNELNVYSSSDVRDWLRQSESKRATLAPLRRIVRANRAPENAIIGPQWDRDNKTILFSEIDGDDRIVFSRLRVTSGVIDRLWKSSNNFMGQYIKAIYPSGRSLMLDIVDRSLELAPAKYPVQWGEFSNGNLRFGRSGFAQENELAARYVKHTYKAVGLGDGSLNLKLPPDFKNVWISPTGNLALVQTAGFKTEPGSVKKIPYSRLAIYDISDIRADEAGSLVGRNIDDIEPSLNADAFWSEDGRQVILVNVIDKNPTNLGKPSLAVIVNYDVATGERKQLAQLEDAGGRKVTSVRWNSEGRSVLVSRAMPERSTEIAEYSFSSSEPVRNFSTAPDPSRELQVNLVATQNDPPRIVARLGKISGFLTPPDQVLSQVQWQKQTTFRWMNADYFSRLKINDMGVGGLVLPRGYRPGQRVPLVIHLYYYDPTTFQPDGCSPLDAAQVLAGRGIAVLHMNKPRVGKGTDRLRDRFPEGQELVKQIDAAVEALEKAGIVDPTRVGITGFSNSGAFVHYAITHPGRVKLAAAMGSDFWQGAYTNYLLHGANLGPEAERLSYENLIGASGSFWEDKEGWLKGEPSFNTDKIVTPLLVSNHSLISYANWGVRRDYPGVFAMLGAFIRNRKPIDYMYMPHSSHYLYQPRERMAEMGAMVDWMAFWLQGYEDPDPQKAEQYERWRRLRPLQQESLQKAGVTP